MAAGTDLLVFSAEFFVWHFLTKFNLWLKEQGGNKKCFLGPPNVKVGSWFLVDPRKGVSERSVSPLGADRD